MKIDAVTIIKDWAAVAETVAKMVAADTGWVKVSTHYDGQFRPGLINVEFQWQFADHCLLFGEERIAVIRGRTTIKSYPSVVLLGAGMDTESLYMEIMMAIEDSMEEEKWVTKPQSILRSKSQ